MEGPKSRPTVTITTYASSKSSYPNQMMERHSSRTDQGGNGESATRSDSSTNFFRGDRQSGSPLTSKSRGCPRQRVLSDLSQIKGPTGSVRGHKDVVRRSLEGIKVAYRHANPSSSSSLSPASLLSLSSYFANQLACRDGRLNGNNSEQSGLCSNPGPSKANNNNSLLAIGNELYLSEYLEHVIEEEQNLCVAYTTTLGVIRRTFEDSKILKSILGLNLVKFEERDIYLNQEYKFQLRMRTGGSMLVPALFVDGQYIGGAQELETMNENGELQVLLAKFKMPKAASEVCLCCGNARFIACQSCNGSRKSTIHHFKFNSVALRCINCDKNDGLVRCPVCSLKEMDASDELDQDAERIGIEAKLAVDENVDLNNNS